MLMHDDGMWHDGNDDDGSDGLGITNYYRSNVAIDALSA